VEERKDEESDHIAQSRKCLIKRLKPVGEYVPLKLTTQFLNAAAKKLAIGQKFIYDEEDEFEGCYCEVATLTAGKSFGELALISSKPRAATIQCSEDTHFATIYKKDYQEIIGKSLKKYLAEKIDLLKNVPCLSFWSRTSLGKFSYFFEEVKYQRGKI
jgi:hypothetical protein